MRVFAIDTALGACSAAVLDTGSGMLIAHEQVPMARGHAEALMPMIRRVIDHSGLTFDDLDRIAVTTGPGSFTGLRVGIAAARGLGLGTGKPVVGVSTLSAFAAPLIAADASKPVVAVVDARHDHVYLQVFGAGGRTLVTPRLAPLREALRAGTTSGAPRIAGTAADWIASQWPPEAAAPGEVHQHAAPEILWVGRLGALAKEESAPPKPLYLRAPDAQPQHASQLARK